MGTEMKITDEEVQDTAFAIGALVAAAELFLEGRMLNAEGEKKLDKAMEIIDQYGITDEEIGFYVNEYSKDKGRRITTNFLRRKGVM